MPRKQSTFSNKTKFSTVLEAIKRQRQMAETAPENNVHPNQITQGENQFLG